MTTIPSDFIPAPDLLAGKVILVTGATGGFGNPVSKALAQHGATVVLLGKNLRMVEALYDEIEQAGLPLPAIYTMDLSGASEQDYLDLARQVGGSEEVARRQRVFCALDAELIGSSDREFRFHSGIPSEEVAISA